MNTKPSLSLIVVVGVMLFAFNIASGCTLAYEEINSCINNNYRVCTLERLKHISQLITEFVCDKNTSDSTLLEFLQDKEFANATEKVEKKLV